jgi:hypothetical protein
MKILYQKYEKEFTRVYREAQGKEGGEEEKGEETGELEEEEYREVMEKMGYAEKGSEKEGAMVEEINKNILQGKLTKKNVLLLLCQIEKIQLNWMYTASDDSEPDKQQEQKSAPVEGGAPEQPSAD